MPSPSLPQAASLSRWLISSNYGQRCPLSRHRRRKRLSARGATTSRGRRHRKWKRPPGGRHGLADRVRPASLACRIGRSTVRVSFHHSQTRRVPLPRYAPRLFPGAVPSLCGLPCTAPPVAGPFPPSRVYLDGLGESRRRDLAAPCIARRLPQPSCGAIQHAPATLTAPYSVV